MASGNRDALWNSAWEAFYDSYYFEIALSRVIARWKFFDLATKILVAITATGSAIAGWSLWAQEPLKYFWALVAGIAAIASIFHAVIQVQAILENLSDLRARFSALRIALDTLRQQLAIYPEFNVQKENEKLLCLKDTYSDLVSKFNGDLLLTDKLAHSSQDELNKKIGA